MRALDHRADLFSDRDANSAVGGSFCRLVADQFGGGCEASATSRQSNQTCMREKYFESNGDANELDLARSRVSVCVNRLRLSRLAPCALDDRVTRGGGNCAPEKARRN